MTAKKNPAKSKEKTHPAKTKAPKAEVPKGMELFTHSGDSKSTKEAIAVIRESQSATSG